MKAYDAVKEVAARSGVSLNSIGREMGKPSNYVSNGASRGSTPKADTLAAMLAACGWSLMAVPPNTEVPGAITIDPATDE